MEENGWRTNLFLFPVFCGEGDLFLLGFFFEVESDCPIKSSTDNRSWKNNFTIMNIIKDYIMQQKVI